jgi:hypothetical protein
MVPAVFAAAVPVDDPAGASVVARSAGGQELYRVAVP